MGWKFSQVGDVALRILIESCRGGKVFRAEDLLALQVSPRLVDALVATHAEQKEGTRYKGSVLEPSAKDDIWSYDGVYDLELLTAVAGDFGISLSFPYATAKENAEHVKSLLITQIWGA